LIFEVTPWSSLPFAIADLPRLEKLDLRWTSMEPLPWFAGLEDRGCLVFR
jgi:hypothetical protein